MLRPIDTAAAVVALLTPALLNVALAGTMTDACSLAAVVAIVVWTGSRQDDHGLRVLLAFSL